MINREKLNAKELADIVFEVQRKVHYCFDLLDVFKIMRYTIHKAEQTGHDESYVPLLLMTELEDFVMRERINARGGLVNVHGV